MNEALIITHFEDDIYWVSMKENIPSEVVGHAKLLLAGTLVSKCIQFQHKMKSSPPKYYCLVVQKWKWSYQKMQTKEGRLRIQLIIVKGVKLYSFQLQDLNGPTLLFVVTTSPCRYWVICAPAAFLVQKTLIKGNNNAIMGDIINGESNNLDVSFANFK